MIISKLSVKQKEIFKFAMNSEKYLICDGSIRSGKTVSMVCAFIVWAMTNFKNTNFAVCGKTIQSAERNILKPLLEIEALTGIYTFDYKRQEKMLIVSNGDIKNNIYLFGGKDNSSFMLVQGITLAGVLFDEVALMPQSFVNQCVARTISYTNRKIWFNCNPESPNHWFYTDWIQKAEERNIKHIHFLMDDNPILTAEMISEAKKDFDGVFYQRYILGQWVTAEGAIYSIFSENKKTYYTENPDFDYIQLGLDFGGNHSAHAICATGIKNNYSKLTVLMSERMKATGTSPNDLYNFVENFVEKVENKYGKYITALYADSAEQTLINGLRSRLCISVKNSLKNPIIDRIRATTSLMADHRFFITHDCKPLEEAFECAVYDETQLDDTRLDNGSTPIDDLDSFEYSFENRLRQYARE